MDSPSIQMCYGCTRLSFTSSIVSARSCLPALSTKNPCRCDSPPSPLPLGSSRPWSNPLLGSRGSSSVLRHLHGSPRHLPSSRPPTSQTPESVSVHGTATRSSLGTSRRERVLQQLAGRQEGHKPQTAVNVLPYSDELLVCWRIPNICIGSAKGRRIRLMVDP